MYEAGVRNTPEPTEPTRPRQATMAAVLLGLFAVLGVLASLLGMSVLNDASDHGQSVSVVLYLLVYLQLAFSTTQAVCGVFVWQGRNWARIVAIVLSSINLAGVVVYLFGGAVFQAIAAFGVNIALLRLLNNYDVQAWCRK